MPSDPDAFDPKEYALRVVNPYWKDGLESQVRYVLERARFQVVELVTASDESTATFMAARQDEHLTQDQACASLRQSLINAGCYCGLHDLTLAVEAGRWKGTFTPSRPEDDIDPQWYIDRVRPQA